MLTSGIAEASAVEGKESSLAHGRVCEVEDEKGEMEGRLEHSAAERKALVQAAIVFRVREESHSEANCWGEPNQYEWQDEDSEQSPVVAIQT